MRGLRIHDMPVAASRSGGGKGECRVSVAKGLSPPRCGAIELRLQQRTWCHRRWRRRRLVTGKDSEVIPPRYVDDIYVPFMLDKPMLDKRPPHRIERASRHGLEFFYSPIVPLVEILDDINKPANTTIIGRNLAIVVFCDDEVMGRVRFPGRRGGYRGDPDAVFCEIGLEVLPIPVVVVLEE